MHPKETQQKLTDLAAKQDRHTRGFHARQPKKLANVLAQLLTKRGYGATTGDARLREAWATVVGPAMAKQCEATRLNRGKLEVIVANSLVRQEIQFDERRFLKRIQAKLPDANITGLRFRVGKLT